LLYIYTMQRIKWTEREFSFDYHQGMFPFFIERLHGTPARIEELIKNIPEEILLKKNGNEWSVKEHIGHLIDLEELHDGRIDDYLNKLETLRPADMQNRKTHEANHNTRNTNELVSEFRQVREHFLVRLEKLNPILSALHPRLKKPMRVVDLAFFLAEHDDCHLTIMRELINK